MIACGNGGKLVAVFVFRLSVYPGTTLYTLEPPSGVNEFCNRHPANVGIAVKCWRAAAHDILEVAMKLVSAHSARRNTVYVEILRSRGLHSPQRGSML